MPAIELQWHGPVAELVMSAQAFGRTLFPFRAYFVDGLLIDTGPPSQARLMRAFLRELPVRQVVNTHHHEDHAGNNALIARTLGLTPAAHALAVPLLANLPPIQLYRRLTWGEAELSTARGLGDVVETPRHRFRVLHTPGHSPDHVALWEEQEGWLFSGDLFIADRLKLLRREEDPHQLLSSLEATAALGAGTLFCAHRGVVREGSAALARKHDAMAELRERVREGHAQGLPVKELTRRLLGPEAALSYVSLGDFSKRNLIEAFLPNWVGPATMSAGRRSRSERR